MSLVCAISGVPVKDPVVSSHGYLFDRAEILSHLRGSDSCPISNEPLNEFGLTTVNFPPSFVDVRTGTTARSVPAYLNLFRAELDNLEATASDMQQRTTSSIEEIAFLRTRRKGAEVVLANLVSELADLKARKAELLAELDAAKNGAKSKSVPKRQKK